MTSIEDCTGSVANIDYVNIIKKCVDKIVSCTNDRLNLPKLPQNGFIWHSNGKELSYNRESLDYRKLRTNEPQDHRYIFYDLETTGFYKEESPPDLTEYSFIDLYTEEFIQSLVNPSTYQ